MKVILFSGKAEAGKTTAANILKDILEADGKKVVIIPYAFYVKCTAKLIWSWNGEKDEEGRRLLQWWGTDVVRKKYPDFWVNNVMELAKALDGEFEYILIDDCRFPNEIECWKLNPQFYWDTVAVRVERPGYNNSLTLKQKEHPSETALDHYGFDWTIQAIDISGLRTCILSLYEGGHI